MKGKIKNPCPVSWDSMKKTEDITQRFCTSCDKIVHNITQLQPAEIRDLYNKKHGNLCVKALNTQVKNSNAIQQKWKKRIKNIKVVSTIVLAGMIGNAATAQNQHIFKFPNTYKVEQEDNHEKIITIKGKIKVEKFLYWVKARSISATLYTQDGLQISEIVTVRNNKFEITIDKAVLGEKFTIEFQANDAVTFKINDIEAKNSNFIIYMEEEVHRTNIGFIY